MLSRFQHNKEQERRSVGGKDKAYAKLGNGMCVCGGVDGWASVHAG